MSVIAHFWLDLRLALLSPLTATFRDLFLAPLILKNREKQILSWVGNYQSEKKKKKLISASQLKAVKSKPTSSSFSNNYRIISKTLFHDKSQFLNLLSFNFQASSVLEVPNKTCFSLLIHLSMDLFSAGALFDFTAKLVRSEQTVTSVNRRPIIFFEPVPAWRY